MVSWACAQALSATANTAPGAAASVNPATTLRLLTEVETARVMVVSLLRFSKVLPHQDHRGPSKTDR